MSHQLIASVVVRLYGVRLVFDRATATAPTAAPIAATATAPTAPIAATANLLLPLLLALVVLALALALLLVVLVLAPVLVVPVVPALAQHNFHHTRDHTENTQVPVSRKYQPGCLNKTGEQQTTHPFQENTT